MALVHATRHIKGEEAQLRKLWSYIGLLVSLSLWGESKLILTLGKQISLGKGRRGLYLYYPPLSPGRALSLSFTILQFLLIQTFLT